MRCKDCGTVSTLADGSCLRCYPPSKRTVPEAIALAHELRDDALLERLRRQHPEAFELAPAPEPVRELGTDARRRR